MLGGLEPLTTRDKLRRTAIALVVIGGLGAIGWGCTLVGEVTPEGEVVQPGQAGGVVESGDPDVLATAPPPPGPDDTAPPQEEVVERLYPADGTEVLRQEQVGIDLGALYDAELIINGVPVPEDELVRRPELNQVFFTPVEGAAIEELQPGPNQVIARITRLSDDTFVREVTWTFNVT